MGQLTCTVAVGSSVDLQGGTGKFKKGKKKNYVKCDRRREDGRGIVVVARGFRWCRRTSSIDVTLKEKQSWDGILDL